MRAFLCICLAALYASLAGCYWGPPPGGDRERGYWNGDGGHHEAVRDDDWRRDSRYQENR